MYKICLHICSLCALVLCACDLQPKIASIPDSVGMFIEDRYPALLADPQTQPEIYNSAVTDYGVYASPELYGSGNTDDYVLYASVDDYVLVPDTNNSSPVILSVTEQTDENTTEQEVSEDYLIVPVYGGNTVLDKMPSDTVKQDKSKTDVVQSGDTIIVARGDTAYSLARKNNMSMADFAKINDLKEPYNLRVGQKLKTKASAVDDKQITKKQEIPNVISKEKVQEIKVKNAQAKAATQNVVKPNNTTRVDLQEITVAKGDTLYSLSRKYEIPVNDLAVMNKLNAPFNLSVGQKIKVPKMSGVKTRLAVEQTQVKIADKKPVITEKGAKTSKTVPDKKTVAVSKPEKPSYTEIKPEPKNKISSDPKKTLPKITARSSSKFSWPVRGSVLSGYGPKKGGLVNDGINISAAMGTVVKAAENGVVAYAGNEVKGMGNLIIIQHSDGWMTVYAHLNSMDVRRGTKVSVGQAIGKIGKTGKVDKPQLHFEIRKGTKSYNPTQYLKK